MPEPAPRASVIVPTYRDWEALAACLACLEAQTVPAQDIEILIANNNPEEAVPESVTLPPNARIVWRPKPGSYAARNAAVAVARGAVLCFTDSDCRPESDWVANALALFDRQPEVDRIGGAVILTPKGESWTTPELYDRIFGLRQERYVARGYAATANLVVRRDLFDRAGPFDDSLYSSGDKEWNRRAEAAGSRIVLGEDVRVRHPARDSVAALAKKKRRVLGGRVRMKSKGRLTLLLKTPKYLIPSLAALGRILSEPGLSARERLQLAALDYRLRQEERREVVSVALNRQTARRA